jgi:Domain of unknown function (DUF4832)/Domain of unknown function (DUF4874)
LSSRRSGASVALAGITGISALASLLVTTAAGAGPALSQRYSPSYEDIPNPDRGMYRYTETHFRADGSGFTPLEVAALKRWRGEDNITLVYRIFYLERFVTRDRFTASDLQRIGADFSSARTAGVKLVVRFAYTDTSGRDAPPARVTAHIRQLAPVLNASADVVSVLQAGFVGRWGEWYETDHFATDRARPWALTRSDWAARRAVLDTLLAATSPGIFLQVRYPSIKRMLLASNDPREARVGIHNDCFLASASDYGTFSAPDDRAWLAEQTRSMPMGGETCQVNPPRSRWPTAAAELAAYHWSYLNADYNRAVLDSWGAGQVEAKRRLGYRLRLISGAFPVSAGTGESMSMHLSVANDGFAAPFRSRPVQIVLRGSGATYVAPVPVDVRTLAPGQTTELALQVPAPSVPGVYALGLALPDPSPRLAGQPAYAVRLANDGTWDASTGRNDLRHSVRIDPVSVTGR